MFSVLRRLGVFIPGLTSAVSFGLIPLFSLPLLDSGIDRASVLSYRLLIAAFAVGVSALLSKVDMKISKKEFLHLLKSGVFYYFSASLLFYSFSALDTGLATVLHFLYPIFVTLIMFFVYKQKVSRFTICALGLSILGVGMISMTGTSFAREGVSAWFFCLGLVAVIGSSLAYAIYIVCVNKTSCLNTMNNLKLTFYVLLIGGIIFATDATVHGGIERLNTPVNYLNAIGLALISTLVANLTLIRSVKTIGGTLTSVLGAMESITAVTIGILVFDEPFRWLMVIGMVLIISAVLLIILSPIFDKMISNRIKRLSKNPSIDS